MKLFTIKQNTSKKWQWFIGLYLISLFTVGLFFLLGRLLVKFLIGL